MEPRRWKRTGSHAIFVSKESSINSRSEEQDTYPVDKDHSNLVKFSVGDHDLNVILEYLNPDAPTSAQKATRLGGPLPTSHNEMVDFVDQALSHRLPDPSSDDSYERQEWNKLGENSC